MCATLFVLSCQSAATIAPLVRLTLNGLPPDADKVTVTVTINGQTKSVDFTPDGSDPLTSLTFGFPEGTTGDATFSVTSYKGDCLDGSGSGVQMLTNDDVHELQITIMPPTLACGTPAAHIIVVPTFTGTSMGTITSVNPPGGINCGQDCDEFYAVSADPNNPTTVTLHAHADVGSFFGWSGACMGTDDCTVSLPTTGDYTVQAAFGSPPCTGWCAETSGTAEDLYGVWGSGPLNVVAVGTNGAIVKWDGTHWTTQTITGGPITQTLRAVTIPTGGTDYIAVGLNGTIVAQSNGTFSKLPAPPSTTKGLFGVAGARVDEIFIVGEGGTYLKGSVSGFSIKKPDGNVNINDPPSAMSGVNINSISVQAGQDNHASAGDMDVNVRRTRGPFGSDYFLDTGSGTPANLNGTWHGGSNIYAVGANSTLVRRATGSNWSVQTPPATGVSLHGVFGFDDKNVYAVGDGGALWFFDGTLWNKVPLPNLPLNFSKNLRAVWGVGATNVYVVGDGGTILHYLQ